MYHKQILLCLTCLCLFVPVTFAAQTVNKNPAQQNQEEPATTGVVLTLDVANPVVVEADGISALKTAVLDMQSVTRELKQMVSDKTAQSDPVKQAAQELVNSITASGEKVVLKGIGEAILFKLNDDAIIQAPKGFEQKIEQMTAKIPKKQIIKAASHTFVVCNKRYFLVGNK